MERENIVENLENFLGGNGPTILFFYTTYIFFNKKIALSYFIIGFIINIFTNFILKGIFKQPRPGINDKQFKLYLENKKRFIYKNGIPYDIYGMPSGHSQLVFFCVTFLFLNSNNIYVLFLYLTLALITLYQRVNRGHHTVSQVICGSIVGVIFGILINNVYKKKKDGGLI